MTYIIAQPCVDLLDKACIEECPVDCIYEGERMLYIHPDECVDCGACEPVCPVEAIFYEDDVPDQWKDYYKANVEFFERPRLAGRRLQDRQDPRTTTRSWPRCRRRRRSTDRPVTRAGPRWPRGSRSSPGMPWPPSRAAARAHPGGIVDLSIGTPVDPVPELVQAALAAAADSPGYPATHGTPALREAAAGWLARRHGVTVSPDAILPVIGTKELVASLPTQLGCGPGDVVIHPGLAYPTYDIGARLAGARPERADDFAAAGPVGPGSGPEPVRLVWLNSPSNPTGAVLPDERLRQAIGWARDHGAVVASDECYLELGWEAEPRSVLHPEVCGGSHHGLLAVHSLSKRSNLAGYRAGFVTGDPALVAELLEIRKHAGLLMPGPVQAAMTAALNDDRHAERAAGQVRGPARAAAPGAGGGGLAGRRVRGRALSLGRARELRRGARALRCCPTPASWSRQAPSTVRRASGTSGPR